MNHHVPHQGIAVHQPSTGAIRPRQGTVIRSSVVPAKAMPRITRGSAVMKRGHGPTRVGLMMIPFAPYPNTDRNNVLDTQMWLVVNLLISARVQLGADRNTQSCCQLLADLQNVGSLFAEYSMYWLNKQGNMDWLVDLSLLVNTLPLSSSPYRHHKREIWALATLLEKHWHQEVILGRLLTILTYDQKYLSQLAVTVRSHGGCE